MSHSVTLHPNWSAMNIALMVLGFVFFWPLGLAMLAYILWGDRVGEISDEARHQFKSACRRAKGRPASRTGNAAFDEYRNAELSRLQEERRKIDEMRAEFDDFLRELRRAKDQEEFDRFMRARNVGPTDFDAGAR